MIFMRRILIKFCNADLRLLIAVLHSSLNHELRLFELVEDFGIHCSDISCNAEVKAGDHVGRDPWDHVGRQIC